MTEILEKKKPPIDYYSARLENGFLEMTPHCACGNTLNEDYFCEQCGRKCQCHLIVCDNETTMATVNEYIRKSSQFSGFKAKLFGEG